MFCIWAINPPAEMSVHGGRGTSEAQTLLVTESNTWASCKATHKLKRTAPSTPQLMEFFLQLIGTTICLIVVFFPRN